MLLCILMVTGLFSRPAQPEVHLVLQWGRATLCVQNETILYKGIFTKPNDLIWSLICRIFFRFHHAL